MKLSQRHLPITRASGRITLQPTVAYCPISPTSKRIKKDQDKVAQDAAFTELLTIRSANGGKKKYGDLQMIVTKYKNRGFNVERQVGIKIKRNNKQQSI
jgi:hypothetical protein